MKKIVTEFLKKIKVRIKKLKKNYLNKLKILLD